MPIILYCAYPVRLFKEVASFSGYGNYRLTIENAKLNDQYEPNETIETAADLGSLPVTNINGRITNHAEEDWYTFDNQDSTSLVIQVTGLSMDFSAEVTVYNEYQVEKGYSYSANKGASILLSGVLAIGRYYLVISSWSGTGGYSLSITRQ